MKKIIAVSLIFAVLGMGLLLGSLWFCLTSLNADAIMVEMPTDAQACSENLMTAVQKGDYTAASGYLYGQVDLGVNREPGDDLGKRLWEAFQESVTWEFIGDCYATTTGVARDVRITTLDPNSVNLQLAERVEEMAESDEVMIYDQEGNILEDVLHQLMLDALTEALEQDAATVSRNIQLNLVYQNGQWWVVPDAALLQAISGGVAG